MHKVIRKVLPEWFELCTGFSWFDPDGDVCTLLGVGGWREAEPLGSLDLVKGENHSLYDVKFCPPGLIASFSYKGEFFLQDISQKPQHWWDTCKPLGEKDTALLSFVDGVSAPTKENLSLLFTPANDLSRFQRWLYLPTGGSIAELRWEKDSEGKNCRRCGVLQEEKR